MALAVTYPDTLEMIVGEQLNLTVDFTNVLAGGTLFRPLIFVTNQASNELIPSAIIGTPFFSGNILNFTFSSAPLRPSTNYIVTFIGTNTVILGAQVGRRVVTGPSTFNSIDGVSAVSILLIVKVIY